MNVLRNLDPEEALERVLSEVEKAPSKSVSLEGALGLALAEDVRADRSYPPFDRAMMDGYAVRRADASREVTVTGTVAAGHESDLVVREGSCAVVMTGATCPAGTEAVVKKEDVQERGHTVLLPSNLSQGQHIAAEGSEFTADTIAVEAGTQITPLAIAILATFGHREVAVIPPPTAVVITTGDELVAADEAVGPTQIRDSNGPMLVALARSFGVAAPVQDHARDTEQSLDEVLERAADADFILLSGGVSMGKYDLVPQALARFGAQPIFHKVTQKPGKPLLFATRKGQLFFGLPGNPLSSHFCFVRYVGPAIRKRMGLAPSSPRALGTLTADLNVKSSRTLFTLAQVRQTPRGFQVTPLVGKGSADIFCGATANAYLRFEPGPHALPEGSTVSFSWMGAWR